MQKKKRISRFSPIIFRKRSFASGVCKKEIFFINIIPTSKWNVEFRFSWSSYRRKLSCQLTRNSSSTSSNFMSSMATDTPSQIYHRLVCIDIATMRIALRSLNNSTCVPKAARTVIDSLLSAVL